MSELGKVTIVAPDQDRSGASNSLTLDSPVRISEIDERTFRVTGTPTDCVHIALTGLLDGDPDMVVSGINAGANLGDDVIYSGTVAAAMEGRFLGYPAIAVSLVFNDKPRYFETAAEVIALLVNRFRKDPLPADTILNINVPDLKWSEIEGFEVTRLGHRHRAEPTIREVDPRGRPMYWIGPAGAEQDAGPGTDFDAIRRGYVSVTPIHVDLTRYQALDQVAGWVAEISVERVSGREAVT
jgi:5'-nucleotidase